MAKQAKKLKFKDKKKLYRTKPRWEAEKRKRTSQELNKELNQDINRPCDAPEAQISTIRV